MKTIFGENDIRYHLAKPWSRGDYTYATNSYIIVRVARLPDIAENESAPNAEKLFADASLSRNTQNAQWVPVPQAVMPPDIECPKCDGTGILKYSDCETDDCEWCNCTGKVRHAICVSVAGIPFDQGYLSMLQGWEISPNGKGKAARLRRDNAEGLLMAMTW